MPLFSYGGPGSKLSEEWHDTRHEARTTTYGLFEWGEIDIERYDLDEIEFTGKYVDRTYILKPRVLSEGGTNSGFDVRDLPTQG
jgi:hypothetical protein